MRRLTFVTLALLIGILPSSSRAAECADPPQTTCSEKTFFICHPTEKYWSPGTGWKPLPAGATIRVPQGKSVVTVRETNTAVFRYELGTEAVDVPEAKQLDTFLKHFGPYLVDVLSVEVEASQRSLLMATQPEEVPDALEPFFAELARSARKLQDTVKSLEDSLRNLDNEIDKIRGLRLRVLDAYGHLQPERLQAAIEAICHDEAACRDLASAHVTGLLADYTEISRKLREAEAAARKLRAFLDQLQQTNAPSAAIRNAAEDAQQPLDELPKLFGQARKALDESDDVLVQVRVLERLLFDGLHAQPTWTSPQFPITLQKGRKVTLKITPTAAAALASAGRLPTVATSFTLLPVWPVQPAVGLSLLHAEGATFPEFGTSKTKTTVDGAEVERFEVVEKKLVDDRFEYGLTLSLTHRGLCRAEGTRCPWLDFTVNPSDDVRALAAGLSYNFGRFRIGAGALWTKHDTLEGGLALGDLLVAEGDLKTGESYDDPNFYVSFSVTGWQPFVSD